MKTYIVGVMLIIPETFTSLDYTVIGAILGWAILIGKLLQWKAQADEKLIKLEQRMDKLENIHGQLIEITNTLNHLREFAEKNWSDAKEDLFEVKQEIAGFHNGIKEFYQKYDLPLKR